MKYEIEKKDIIQIFVITFLGFISTWTVKFPGSEFSAANAVAVYWIEVVLLGFSLYVVCYQLLLKRKLKECSQLSKFLFWIMMFFSIYWVLTTLMRILTHSLLPASFLLPRVVIEAALLFLCLEYFKIKPLTVLIGFITMFSFFVLWDYWILFLGDGIIRGTSPVMGNSYAFAIFYGMIYPLGASLYSHSNKKNQRILLTIYIVSLPIIILTGSRTGLLLGVFLAVLAFIIEKQPVKKIVQRVLVMGLLAVAMIGLILAVGDAESKNQTVRTISVPIRLIQKVVPQDLSDQITELTTFKVVEIDKVTGEEVTEEKNMDKESNISTYQRHDVNQRAYQSIFKNMRNFFFGTGNSLIKVYSGRLEKPHNYFSQYMMAFGVVGFILSSLIYFSPLVFSWFKPKKRIFFRVLVLAYGSLCINGVMQPALGNYVLIFMMMMLSYSLLNTEFFNSNHKSLR